MYKAKESFTTKSYDVRRGQILAEDFTTQDEITEFLEIGYIEEYSGTLEITENGTYEVIDYEEVDVNVSSGGTNNVFVESQAGTGTANLGIKNLIISVDNFNTKDMTDFGSLFADCRKLNIVSLFDTSKATIMYNMFYNCYAIKSIPQFNTSNVENMATMFSNCFALVTVPQFNTSKVTNFNNMFNSCSSLSDDSLNNILSMCINATSYTGTKTLYQLGFRSSNYSTSKIEVLSNYQAFTNAGWTIGY